MALTESNMISLGTTAPNFELLDVVSGEKRSLKSLSGKKATVVMFTCNHCPFVIHVNDELVRLGNDYKDKGVSFIAISSNDVVNYPADSPEKMKELALELKYPFPYLYDETQEVASAFDAACTPDFYVFDADLSLTYRGRLDKSRPGNGEPCNGEDLRSAIEKTMNKEANIEKQYPSAGCNIKWIKS